MGRRVACAPIPTAAQDATCRLLCAPDFKFEPTVTLESLGSRARVDVGGQVEQTERETVLELIFSVGIPTTIPRVGFTLEAIFAPFKGTDEQPFTGETAQGLGRDEIRDNLPEIESELNFDLLTGGETGGWVSSHVDVVDKFSPGELPGDGGAYTHKLNFEWDTALHVFNFLPEGRWLRELELELSIDYMASGIPKAGTWLEASSTWTTRAPGRPRWCS